MKTFVAVVMGLISGLLIYMMAAMLVIDLSGHGTGISPLFVFICLFGGWIASSYLLLRNARTTAKVLARGFLLGAAEWMLMILVGVIYSSRAVTSAASGSGSEAVTAGAAIGGGLVAFMTGGVSLVMILICLAGFAIVHFMSKEMKPETAGATKKCPECAELIQQDARKCRYCGTVLTQHSPA